MKLSFSVRFVSVLTALSFLAACGTSPTGRKQILIGSKSDLALQGEIAFQKLKDTSTLTTDPVTIDFVSCVANAIVDQLEGRDAYLDWELIIIEKDVVNAFVLPGGKIAVYTGILEVTDNDDQLAAILGHEVAHVIANHPLERTSGKTVLGYGVGLGGAVIGGTPIARRSSYTALQILSQFGLLLPFTRKQESEADVIGVEYMANAGFDPRESVQLWKNMGAASKNEPPEFMSTHPANETRIKGLVGEFQTALPLYNQAREAGRKPDCGAPPKYHRASPEPAPKPEAEQDEDAPAES
ncbi:MAG: M48 family metallopeptidase [Pseudomonadota bacterium]